MSILERTKFPLQNFWHSIGFFASFIWLYELNSKPTPSNTPLDDIDDLHAVKKDDGKKVGNFERPVIKFAASLKQLQIFAAASQDLHC